MEKVFGVDEAELLLRHRGHAPHLELQVVAVQVALVVFSVGALREFLGTKINEKQKKQKRWKTTKNTKTIETHEKRKTKQTETKKTRGTTKQNNRRQKLLRGTIVNRTKYCE